jgi:hypothetical protein
VTPKLKKSKKKSRVLSKKGFDCFVNMYLRGGRGGGRKVSPKDGNRWGLAIKPTIQMGRDEKVLAEK